ncbi:MAG: aminotransferase class I/II-fold pyridoxal phosphate-dependent enzyme [Alphaproteobacteria bacterium]|nr:aminotransferase class I/II-fold pyridoxal phosphate-dependent enzyme [Alphaproteobacteria bacterium]
MSGGVGGRPATWLAQALGWVEPRFGEVVPPLHLSTTYERSEDLSYPKGRIYGRDQNPTYDQAEALLTRLEGGQAALLFASGMAAATACFLALRPGDHVVAPKVMYWALRKWLEQEARAWGLRVDFFRNDSIEDLARLVRPGETRLVWIETPANPTWLVTDIARAAEIAHAAGARLAVDSTVATPILTRPIEHGADLVMHAATKYLNGHSDVLAGALVTARMDEFWQRVRSVRASLGAVLSPFEAWLLLRGMRTLHLRVHAACRNAERIALALQDHSKVLAVHYPGLGNDPGHAVAARQMQGGFGGMLSVRVTGGQEGAVRFAAALRLFKRATSLGGVESLVEHRASVEGAGSPAPSDMLRLSVGAEDADDLIEDLIQALGRI